MKKLYIFWALCLMSAMSISAFAQEKKLTVNDGAAATSVMTPIALKYCDNWTESQHIIPASLLTEMAGGQILGLQYYTSATSAFTSKASIELVMWEVSASTTTLNGFLNYGQPNAVYTGKVQFVKEDGTVRANIFFDTPFAYQGGSIVIDAKNTSPLWTNDVIYYGQTVNGASWAGYNSETSYITGTQQNFAPKTTFYYEKEDEPVDEREVITHIELEGFNPYYFHVGDVWSYESSESVTGAIHPVNASAPYYVPETMGNLYLVYSGNEMYISKENTTLLKGTYIFDMQVRIDDENGLLYRFPYRDKEGAPTVTVNGQQWEVEEEGYSVYPEDDYCYFIAKSPVFDMVGQGIENTSANFGGSQKFLRDGMLLIERNGKTYNALGTEVK